MIKNSLKLTWTRGLLGIAVPLLATITVVQAAEVSGSTNYLEEIVITAQKYSQDLQKTPLAVTAVSGETLRTLGITRGDDLTQVVPNLVIGQNGASAQVGMRGVISTSIGDQGDPSIAFNIDGVYIARARSALTGLYDIERVEVLRGPQGTLYGRNSINGTINVVTNKPDLTAFAAEGALQFGNYNAMLTYGMMNIPVTDTFGLRASFQSDRHDGYSHNAPARDSNDLESKAGRLQGLWKPTDNFSALLSLSLYQNGGVGGGAFASGAPTGLYTVATGFTPFNYQEAPGQQYSDELARDATLTLDWKLPFFTVSYVGNIRSDNYGGAASPGVNGPLAVVFRTLPSDAFGGVCATANDPSCTNLRILSKSRQSSSELRLSNQTDRLKWVLGAYYFKENVYEYIAVDPCPCSPSIGIISNYTPIQNVTHAVFGQATFSLTNRLRLTGGARYNVDFKGQTGGLWVVPIENLVGTGPNGCIICSSTAPAVVHYAGERYKKLTYRVGLDYDLTPDSLLYVALSTGYKDGGFGDGIAPDNFPFKPENMRDYELGWKSELLDRRLTVNVDLFHELYADYQSTASQFKDGRAFPYTVNAGKAIINGIEIESNALVTPQDRVGLNATYLHAYYDSFFLPFGDQFNGNQPESLADKDLPYAPATTFRLSYQHSYPLAAGGSIVPRIDTGYVASQNLDYHNYPAAAVPAYTRTGLSLTYNAPKTWSAQLWVKNLENKAVLVTQQLDNDVPLAYEGLVGKDGFYLPPRTFGIRLSGHF